MNRYAINFSNKEEWLKIREKFITGTEIPVVMGLSNFESPKELFERKINKIPKLQTEAMGWGLRLEPLVAQEYAKEKGFRLRKPNKIFVNEPIAVTLDYLRDKTIYEIKTSTFWKNEIVGIPKYVYAQVQAQLYATGFPKAYVVALIGGNRLSEFEILPNEDFITEMVDFATKFREALDNNDYTIFENFVESKKEQENQKIDTISLDITTELIDEYVELSNLISQLETRKNEIGDLIKEYCKANNYENITLYDKIEAKKVIREAVDYKTLVNKYIPDKVNEAKKITEYITLRILNGNGK